MGCTAFVRVLGQRLGWRRNGIGMVVRERKENGGEWEIWQREQSTKIKHTPARAF